ncbi:MAG: hypothetical protein QNJ54_27210 [Prochloraceae cyanobacterium]|nr:hypothetical protein [Prochloraceae cyanobacterium]
MNTIPDTEIKEIKDLINSRFDQVVEGLKEVKEEVKQVKEDVKKLEIGQAKNSEKLNGIVTRLDGFEKTVDGRFGNLETQVNKQDNRFWAFILLLGSSLVGILGKLVFFPTKPF